MTNWHNLEQAALGPYSFRLKLPWEVRILKAEPVDCSVFMDGLTQF